MQLTSTSDVLGHLKEYFEDLLNPIHKSSVEEAELFFLGGVGLSITGAEVTEVAYMHHSSSFKGG